MTADEMRFTEGRKAAQLASENDRLRAELEVLSRSHHLRGDVPNAVFHAAELQADILPSGAWLSNWTANVIALENENVKLLQLIAINTNSASTATPAASPPPLEWPPADANAFRVISNLSACHVLNATSDQFGEFGFGVLGCRPIQLRIPLRDNPLWPPAWTSEVDGRDLRGANLPGKLAPFHRAFPIHIPLCCPAEDGM